MSTLTVDLPAALGRGQEATTLTFAQISLRGVIVFMATLSHRCWRERSTGLRRSFPLLDDFGATWISGLVARSSAATDDQP